MKSPVLSPTRALCGITIGLLMAACSGSGGGTPPDGGPCCYDYSGVVMPIPQVGPDPLLPREWHLFNYGQDGGTAGEDLRVATPGTGAWALGTKGEGVRVAIVDDAVEVVHPDLAPNFDAGLIPSYYNYRFPGQLPLPYYFDEDHGTSVAGIALARDDNWIGGAGVAPRASMGAYNALATSRDADIADALRRDPHATGVYNNSWGSPDNGVLNAAESSFTAAIAAGITTGRNGKGSIYVFPAGNGGCYLRDGSGACALSENSNFDGYVNQRGVIAVCTVDDNGRAPFYAEPGANVLVCGRSGSDRIGITTTKVRGEYRSDFSGTSASTPMISGIVALMLRARLNAGQSDLSWRDVRLILAKTARENSDPGWVASSVTAANGQPKRFNPKFGFGAADAAAAVELARTWPSVEGGSPVMRRCTFERALEPALQIPDSAATPATDIIDAGSCGVEHIEFVEVRFRASHPYAGDLRIELISPGNLVSLLANERVCNLDNDATADSCGSYDDPSLPASGWQFGSVRHLEERAAGQWTLRVTDAQAGDAGVWRSWGLTIWGR